MVEDVIDTGHHLIMGQCQCVLRIQDGELRHDLLISEHMPDLLMSMRVRDHRPCIHL